MNALRVYRPDRQIELKVGSETIVVDVDGEKVINFLIVSDDPLTPSLIVPSPWDAIRFIYPGRSARCQVRELRSLVCELDEKMNEKI